MQNVCHALLFHLERAQAAYQLYLQGKKYYQALRIYKANQKIYFLLNENAHMWNQRDKRIIVDFFFHLEDWFAQFDQMVASKDPQLTDDFIFARFEDSPAFPQTITELIRNLPLS